MNLGLSILLLFFGLLVGYSSQAQTDSTVRLSYFVEQNAIPSPKGRIVYNNSYLLVNSISYQLTERIKISAGLFLPLQRPPFYTTVQYTIPLSSDLFVGCSVGYYQLEYSRDRFSYVIVPQLLVSKGDQYTNTTFTAGLVKGRFLVDDNFFFSTMVNLPSRVNFALSLSHRRQLGKELSVFTQNVYTSAQPLSNNRYSELVILSGGIGWQLYNRSILKAGVAAILLPKAISTNPPLFLPFLGYSHIIR